MLLHPLLLLRRIHALVLPRRFLPFCPHQCVHLLEVQPSIFVFLGDEYTSSSQPQFNMSLYEIFRMLNMLTHCQGHLNTPLNNTSTDTQCVESLYNEQIQCICTWLNCFRIVFIRPLWDFFFLGLQYCSVGTLFNRYMQLSYCASLVSFYKFRTPRNDMIYSFFLPVAIILFCTVDWRCPFQSLHSRSWKGGSGPGQQLSVPLSRLSV